MNSSGQNNGKKLSATEIKKQISDSLQLCRSLKAYCNQCLKALDNTLDDCSTADFDKCQEMKHKLEQSLQFVSTPTNRTDILNKLLKTERKKRWKLKKRRLERVKHLFYRNLLNQRNQ